MTTLIRTLLSSSLLVAITISSASAQTMYGVASDSMGLERLVTIDLATGTATPVSSETFDVDLVGLDFAADGRLHGFSKDRGASTGFLFTVDLTTGELTVEQSFNGLPPGNPLENIGIGFELALDGSELVLVGDGSGMAGIYGLNRVTGQAELVNTVSVGRLHSLALDPDCTYYSVEESDDTVVLGTIDPVSSLSSFFGFGFLNLPSAIDFGPAGRLFGAGFKFPPDFFPPRQSLVEYDTGTGAVTPIGPFGPDVVEVGGLAFGPASPSSPCLPRSSRSASSKR